MANPAGLADSFLGMLKTLASFSSLFNSWYWVDVPEYRETEGRKGVYPFVEVREELASAIERNMGIEDDGTPHPSNGYLMIFGTKCWNNEDDICCSVRAGRYGFGTGIAAFANRAHLTLAKAPDPSLVSYDMLRSILLVLNETWEATWGWAAPGDLPHGGDGRPVRPAWMSYVSPHFAPLMTPPASAIVEHRPNGGLFLAATRDVFETTNPSHMAVAREIEAALQPLNDIPNPNDAPYR